MKKLELDVPEHAGAFAEGLGQLIADIKKANEDGFKVGDDVAPILASLLSNLVPHIAKFNEIKEDIKADAFGSAIALQAALKKVL